MRTYRAELLRSTSRGSALFLLLCLGLAAFGMVNAGPQHHPPLWGFRQAAIFVATLLLGRSATLAAADHAGGTIRPWLIADPVRSRVVLQKLAASLTVALGTVALAGVLGCALSVALGTVPSAGDAVAAVGALAIAAVGFTLFGHAVGVATRSVPAALAVTLTWILPAEAVLDGRVPHAATVLPGLVAHEITTGALAPGLSWPAAVAHAVLPFMVLEAVAVVLFVRRDLTS